MCSLHGLVLKRSAKVVEAVNNLLLKVILLMRNLILATLAIDKWLIHAVFVVQGGHFVGRRSIIVAKELLHLTFTLVLSRLKLSLELIVDHLTLLPFLFVGGLLRTYLFMPLSIFESFKHMGFVEFAVEGRRLSFSSLLLYRIHMHILLLLTIIKRLKLRQVSPMLTPV